MLYTLPQPFLRAFLHSRRLYFFLGVFIFGYVLLRAVFLPPYYDELSTFYLYVQTGACQPFYSHFDTNNHVLNSFLAHVSYLVFGCNMIALRLPNVLSCLLYLWAVWKLQRLLQSKFIAFSWFIVMAGSIYLLSFFSLARGYGLSIGLLLAAVYCLVAYSRAPEYKFFFFGLLLLSMAVWANLVLNVTVVVAGGLFFLLAMRDTWRNRSWKKAAALLVTFVALFALPLGHAVQYALALKEQGRLSYFGFDEGFIDAIGVGTANEFAGGAGWGKTLLLALAVIYVAAIILQLLRKRMDGISLLLHLLLWGTVGGTILLHVFFDVHYPRERTALHFFVLFMAAFVFSLDRLEWKFVRLLPAFPAVLLLFQLLNTLNLRYVPCWKTESVPFSFYEKISKWKAETGRQPTISAVGLLGGIIDFYDFNREAQLNVSTDKDFPGTIADFLVLNSWNEGYVAAGYDTLEIDRETGVVLLQRQTSIEWKYLRTEYWIGYSGAEEFVRICQVPADTFAGKPFCFDVSLLVQAGFEPFDCWVSCIVHDSTGQAMLNTDVLLQRTFPDYQSPRRVDRRLYFKEIPAGAKLINFVVWNVKKEPFLVSDVEVRMYTLE